jgi:hypothetical protein
MAGYRQRLETVKAPPPYDEFALLEESWRGMRPVIEAQLTVCAHTQTHTHIHTPSHAHTIASNTPYMPLFGIVVCVCMYVYVCVCVCVSVGSLGA